jgi:hypothetical protein
MERMEHDASVTPEGWITVASIQTNGRDLAIQINEEIIPHLCRERIEKVISRLSDSLYRVRPDLRPQ